MSDVVYNVTIFGLKFNIKPVAFTLPFGGGWDIYWYGIIIATGFLLAIIYAWKNAERFNLDIDRLIDVVLVSTPVAILCARSYYLIFDGEKLSGISEFFGMDGSGFSGLAIYGGVIGAAVSAIIMCKVRKVNVLDALDISALGFLIGQGIGRWGNFFNQEAFGSATGSDFWGMTSENVASELGTGKLAHPCFLYESIWCIAGLFLLHKLSKNRKFSGQIVLGYGVWYGFGRTIIEGLRTDSLYIGPFRVSQMLSLLLCITSVVVYTLIIKRRKESEKDTEYVPIFGDLDDIIAVGEETDQEETGSEPEYTSTFGSLDDTVAYGNNCEDIEEKNEVDQNTSDDTKID